jgi:hypothetical protein
MRSWTSLASAGALALLLAGCALVHEQAPGELVVRGARFIPAVDGTTLELALDCRLSGPMSDALDRGIPLTFKVDVHVDATPIRRRIELRYFPLSRRYLLRDPDSGRVLRSYAASAALLDGLRVLHLPLDGDSPRQAAGRARVQVGLERSALPGPLRLPALFEPAWHLRSAEYAWPIGAG